MFRTAICSRYPIVPPIVAGRRLFVTVTVGLLCLARICLCLMLRECKVRSVLSTVSLELLHINLRSPRINFNNH